MKKLLTAATLSLAATTASASVSEAEEFCEGAVEYARAHVLEENAYNLHVALKKILVSENINVNQKFMSVYVFTAFQDFAYNIPEDATEEDYKRFIRNTYRSCMKRADWHTPKQTQLDDMREGMREGGNEFAPDIY